MGRLILEPGELTFEAVTELAPQVRASDLLECTDGDAFTALCMGMRYGPSWTVLRDSEEKSHKDILGAFGWTRDSGTIWSLFKELTWAESRAILRLTPMWVRSMLQESGKPFLWNFVSADNQPAMGWLLASRCFVIDYRPVMLNASLPVQSYYFVTKPLERLP